MARLIEINGKSGEENSDNERNVNNIEYENNESLSECEKLPDSKDLEENDKLICKLLGILSSFFESISLEFFKKYILFDYYKNKIDEYKDEIAGIKSVTFSLYSTDDDEKIEKLIINTIGLSYDQIYNKLKEYKVVNSLDNIILDDENNLIIEDINEDWNLDEYTNEEKIIGKFHAIMSSIYEGIAEDYCLKYCLHEYYENRLNEFENDIANIKTVTVDISLRKNGEIEQLKIDTSNLTYNEIYNKLKVYNICDEIDDIILDRDNNLVVSSSIY